MVAFSLLGIMFCQGMLETSLLIFVPGQDRIAAVHAHAAEKKAVPGEVGESAETQKAVPSCCAGESDGHHNPLCQCGDTCTMGPDCDCGKPKAPKALDNVTPLVYRPMSCQASSDPHASGWVPPSIRYTFLSTVVCLVPACRELLSRIRDDSVRVPSRTMKPLLPPPKTVA